MVGAFKSSKLSEIQVLTDWLRTQSSIQWHSIEVEDELSSKVDWIKIASSMNLSCEVVIKMQLVSFKFTIMLL